MINVQPPKCPGEANQMLIDDLNKLRAQLARPIRSILDDGYRKDPFGVRELLLCTQYLLSNTTADDNGACRGCPIREMTGMGRCRRTEFSGMHAPLAELYDAWEAYLNSNAGGAYYKFATEFNRDLLKKFKMNLKMLIRQYEDALEWNEGENDVDQ